MNLTALQAELTARGFDYLSATRLQQYLNFAAHEVDSYALWPYRLATSTTSNWTSASIALANADRVTNVAISSDGGTTWTELSPRTTEEFNVWEDKTSGPPAYYAVTYAATGGLTLNLFPSNGTAFTVKAVYYKNFADMSAGTDTPTLPPQYHSTILDVAQRMAYRDADDHAAAEALQASIQRDLARMANAMLAPHLFAVPQSPEASS